MSSLNRLLVFILLSIAAVAKCAENVTENENGNGKVLTRRKRYLIFPTGANILVTASLVKPLIFPAPRGFNQIFELDLFLPLPNHARYWIPESKTPKTPPAKKPAKMPDMTEAPSHNHDNHELSPMELDQYLKNHPETWVPPGYNAMDRNWASNQGWSPEYNSNPYIDPDENRFQSLGKSIYFHPRGRSIREIDHNVINEEEHKHWEHYHHYRDRRDLYDKIVDAFPGHNFDMKSCVLRIICESRHFLLPPGQSMVQDIFRALFTFPIKDDIQDDFSNAQRANENECHDVYGKSCPISILYYLIYSKTN